MSEKQPEYKPWSIAWYENTDPKAKASKAVESGDLRFLAIATRGLNIPGLDQNKMELYRKKCGISFIKGIGDVIKDKNDLRKHKLAREFAENYNQVIKQHCVLTE